MHLGTPYSLESSYFHFRSSHSWLMMCCANKNTPWPSVLSLTNNKQFSWHFNVRIPCKTIQNRLCWMRSGLRPQPDRADRLYWRAVDTFEVTCNDSALHILTSENLVPGNLFYRHQVKVTPSIDCGPIREFQKKHSAISLKSYTNIKKSIIVWSI